MDAKATYIRHLHFLWRWGRERIEKNKKGEAKKQETAAHVIFTDKLCEKKKGGGWGKTAGNAREDKGAVSLFFATFLTSEIKKGLERSLFILTKKRERRAGKKRRNGMSQAVTYFERGKKKEE